MKTLKIIILLIITSYLEFSCDSSTYEEISEEVAKPTYTANVKVIIENNCFPCHTAKGAQYPKLETYLEVKDATQKGDVICRIDDQSCGAVMPKSGKMPQTTINTIVKWAANGYQN